MVLLAWGDAVDIGHGRGRLAPPAAASWARIDAAFRDTFGRIADVNEAWRSPQQADENYRRYQAYLRGDGPPAPVALPASQSIHCRGYAVDTDDGYNATAVRILNDHGWFHTVFRNGRLVEPWHFEYQSHRDNHRNQTAGSGAEPFEEDDMYSDDDRARDVEAKKRVDATYAALFGPANVGAKQVSWLDGPNPGTVKQARYGVLPIVIHNQTLIAQQAGRLSAIEAVVEQIAEREGVVLDYTRIEEAAERGAARALEGLTDPGEGFDVAEPAS